MKFFLSIFLSLFILAPLSAHDIHVSVTEIYEDGNGGIELSFRIFFDDLLAAVGLEPGQELPEDYSSSDELIQDYINKKFSIKINGVVQKLEYVESIAAMPAVWISFNNSALKTESIKTIEIQNDILNDLFDDQTNMVNIEIGSKRKNFALDRKKTSAIFKL